MARDKNGFEITRDAKGKWVKGFSGNPGGSSSKAEKIQESVKSVFKGKELHEVLIEMAKKSPREATLILMGFLPYLYPKLSQSQIEAKVSSTIVARAEELLQLPDKDLIALNEQLLKEAKDGSDSN